MKHSASRQLTAALLFILFTATAVRAEMASVARQQVNLRSGPGTRYEVLWELGTGFPMKVIDHRGKWLHVRDFENDTGWIYKRLTNKTPTVIIKKERVNIRKGPSTRTPIVGTATYGSVFKLLTKSRGWVKIRHSDSLVGWIKNTLVWGW